MPILELPSLTRFGEENKYFRFTLHPGCGAELFRQRQQSDAVSESGTVPVRWSTVSCQLRRVAEIFGPDKTYAALQIRQYELLC